MSTRAVTRATRTGAPEAVTAGHPHAAAPTTIDVVPATAAGAPPPARILMTMPWHEVMERRRPLADDEYDEEGDEDRLPKDPTRPG